MKGPEIYAHALKQNVLNRLNDMEAAAASCCWTRSRHFLVQIVRSWWYHKGPCFFRQSNKNGQNSANFRQIKVRSLFSRNFDSRRFQTFFFWFETFQVQMSLYVHVCSRHASIDSRQSSDQVLLLRRRPSQFDENLFSTVKDKFLFTRKKMMRTSFISTYTSKENEIFDQLLHRRWFEVFDV